MLLHKLLHVLYNFGNVETRISIFLLVGGGGGAFCLLSRFSRAIYSSPISAISLSESNTSHLSETDLHTRCSLEFSVCYFIACSLGS